MFMEILTYIVTFAIILPLLLIVYQHNHFFDAYKIPGPPGVLFFGNMFDFGLSIEDFFSHLVELPKKYGTYVKLWLGPKQLQVVLSAPELIEDVLTSNVQLDKSEGYDGYISWLGCGLVNCKGDLWRRPRKIITPTFHFKILEQFFEVFNSASNIFVDLLLKESAKDGRVETWHLAKTYALDVICETSMGIKINAQLKESSYVSAVDDFMEIFMIKYFSILKRFSWYYRFTEEYHRQKKALTILRELTEKVITSRKKEKEAKSKGQKAKSDADNNSSDFGIKKRTALLDLLLDLSDEDSLTEAELNDQVNTFLFAGHHTMSSALCFSLFLAAKYPEMQREIVEEIHSVVGDDNNTPLTMDHVQQLKFTERFLKEAMRIYSPVPFVGRQLCDTFKIGNYVLPKDTDVILFIYAMHHNEKYFPDPEKFDPDRFLPENVAKRHPFSYIPFSAGPRNCIGHRFAMLQLKTSFSNILRKLEVSAVVPEHKIRLGNDAILKALNGTPINVKVRK